MSAAPNLLPPTLDDFHAIAQTVWEGLPKPFRHLAGDIVVRIEDFAEADVLSDMGIEDPFALTGLYVGVDLTQQSIMDPSPAAPMVFLYRRPILDEWADRGDVALDELISHVLVHEIGHHFGLTDEAMDALLEQDA
ncbi:MAG: metallopeptidase family protein [Caulobacterales bacterium]|jgi:predicted Zn-dependent protease with MMP-like domain